MNYKRIFLIIPIILFVFITPTVRAETSFIGTDTTGKTGWFYVKGTNNNYFWGYYENGTRTKTYSRLVSGHRCWTEAPENSLIGLKKLRSNGYFSTEIDIRFTKLGDIDSNSTFETKQYGTSRATKPEVGVPVLLHNEGINLYARKLDSNGNYITVGHPNGATTGDYHIHDVTLNQLLKGNDFLFVVNTDVIVNPDAPPYSKYKVFNDAESKKNHITTFEEALKYSKDNNIVLRIDLKETEQYPEKRIKYLIDMVKYYGMDEKIQWVSDDYDNLKRVIKYCGKCSLALTKKPTPQGTETISSMKTYLENGGKNIVCFETETNMCSINQFFGQSLPHSECPTITSYSGEYDGNAHTVTVSSTSSNMEYSSSFSSTYSTTKPTRTDVGTTYVYPQVQDGGSHNYFCGEKSITITKKTLTIPSSPSNKTYNGLPQTSGISCPTGSTASGTTKETDVGTYTQTCTLSSTTNYKWSDGTTTPKNITWKINKKSIAVTWNTSQTSFTYNGSGQAPSITATINGVESEKINLTRTTKIVPGEDYESTASCSSVTNGSAKCSNYQLTNATSHKFKIIKRPITIKANNQTVSYGTSISKTINDVVVTNLISTHELSSITLTQSTTEITSSGTINPSNSLIKDNKGNTVTNNYQITYTKGNLTINKVDSKCPTLTSVSVQYDSLAHTITIGGNATGGTLEYRTSTDNPWSTTKPARINVGTTTVYIRVAGDKNHNNKDCGNRKITIIKKPLTVTAKNQTISYGSSITKNINQITTTTLATNDTLNSITLTQSTDNVTTNGTIIPSKLVIKNNLDTDITNNYSITYKTGVLKINKVDATCPTISDVTKTYDGEAHSISVSGGSGGTINYRKSTNEDWTTTKPTRTNYGTTTIYVKIVGDSNHNSKECGSKSIKINKKMVTVTPPKVVTDELTYNGSSQIISSDGGSCSTGGTMYYYINNYTTTTAPQFDNTNSNWSTVYPSDIKEINARTYHIWYYCYVKDTTNYTGDFINLTQDVTKEIERKNVTEPSCTARTYNGTSQVLLQEKTTGGYTNDAIIAMNAGKYSKELKLNSNYKWSSGTNVTSNRTKTCSISKKNLLITAKDQTINYNETISKTVNDVILTLATGDTLKSITLTPSTNEVTSNGIITASGAKIIKTDGVVETSVTNNYSISYENGILAILSLDSKCPTVKAYSEEYNGKAHTISLISTPQSKTIQYRTSTTGEWKNILPTRTNKGTTRVYIQVIDNNDNSIENCGSSTITIVPKDITITWGLDDTFIYNGSGQAPSVITPINGVTVDGITEQIKLTRTTKVNAADNLTSTASCLSVSGGQANCNNYRIVNNISPEYEIKKRTINVTAPKANPEKLIYNGNSQIISGTEGSCPNGKMYYYTKDYVTTTAPQFDESSSDWSLIYPTNVEKTNAGKYYMWYYCKIDDTSNNTGSSINIVKSVTKSIERKPVDEPNCNTITYDGKQQTLLIAKTSGAYTNESITGVTAGNYSKELKLNSNYKWSSGTNVTSNRTKTCSIDRKKLTIKSKDQTISYGSDISTKNQVIVEDLLEGDSLKSISLKASTRDVTTQGLIIPSNALINNKSGENITSNYNISYNNGNLTINKVDAECPIISSYLGDYDGKPHSIDVSEGLGGIIQYKTENGTWSSKSITRTNVGTTKVYVRIVGDDNHYTKECGNSNIIIDKRIIEVEEPEVNNQTLVYNGEKQSLLNTVGNCNTVGKMYWYISNNRDSSTPDFSLDKWTTNEIYKKENPGNYHLWYYCKVDDLINNEGKTINTVGEIKYNLSIKKKTITIQANNQEILYGTNISDSTNNVTASLASGDTLTSIKLSPSTIMITNDGIIRVRDAVIKNNQGIDVTDNYIIDYKEGKLVILESNNDNKKTVEIDSTGLNKPFYYTITGLLLITLGSNIIIITLKKKRRQTP